MAQVFFSRQSYIYPVHHLICLYPLILTTALRTLELTVFFWLGCCPPTYTFIDPGNTKQSCIQNVLLSMICTFSL